MKWVADKGATILSDGGAFQSVSNPILRMTGSCFRSTLNQWLTPDTLVPEPENPQSYNRFAYVNNNPIRFNDPTGHCTETYAEDTESRQQCILGWNSIVNYFSEIADYEDYGSFVNHLLTKADIRLIEMFMTSYGIDYGYGMPAADTGPATGPSNGYAWTHAGNQTCQYWMNCYDPVQDYTEVFFPLGMIPLQARIIFDDWENIYFNLHLTTSPGAGFMIGEIELANPSGGDRIDVEDLAPDQQEIAVQESLTGWGGSGCISYWASSCIGGNRIGDKYTEFGLSYKGASFEFGYTWLLRDR